MKHPSPTDIEEMRVRGYDVSTIEKSLEESKRWYLAQAITAKIRDAFSGVRLGEGIGLWQAQGIDAYADESVIADYRLADEKEDWSRITSEALNVCNSSLSFFDAEGMRFHLPAYLQADLAGTYQHSMAYSLTDIDHRPDQFALLSPSQRTAIREYLKFIAEEDDYSFERPSILRALDLYWIE